MKKEVVYCFFQWDGRSVTWKHKHTVATESEALWSQELVESEINPVKWMYKLDKLGDIKDRRLGRLVTRWTMLSGVTLIDFSIPDDIPDWTGTHLVDCIVKDCKQNWAVMVFGGVDAAHVTSQEARKIVFKNKG